MRTLQQNIVPKLLLRVRLTNFSMSKLHICWTFLTYWHYSKHRTSVDLSTVLCPHASLLEAIWAVSLQCTHQKTIRPPSSRYNHTCDGNIRISALNPDKLKFSSIPNVIGIILVTIGAVSENLKWAKL